MRQYDTFEFDTVDEADTFAPGMKVYTLIGDEGEMEWIVESITGAPELGFKVTVYRD